MSEAPVETPTEKPVEKTNASQAEEGEKKLTNKELKELKKRQKLEKRAARKESSGIPNQADEKAAKGKQKSQQQQQQQASHGVISRGLKQEVNTLKKVSLFSHLESKEQRNELSLSQSQVTNIIHPAVLSLTLKYSGYSIVGSIPRCKSMLRAFERVISEYQTPEGTTLTRNLTNYLGYQIDYLKTARPLSVAMGNAIRWLKQEISLISIDTSDSDAKAQLVEKIDTFIKEKIDISDKVIIQAASAHIQNGSTILTFGQSNVLKQLFIYNHEELGKSFNVIVVDSRPLFEGKQLAEELCTKGLKVQYVLINSLSSVIQDVDTVFLGAHAMLSNGFLYSRVGAALIAMKAKNANIPVLVCCESIKFSDRVQLDSVTLNEMGDTEDLINWNQLNHVKKSSVALRKFIETHEEKDQQQQQQQKPKVKSGGAEPTLAKNEMPLKDWKTNPYLNILNIMYDLTPPEYIQKIITEVGALPPSSVPVILREYKASTV
ncbi:unnamed protein product [Cyberlindnera jadinii]|uniref:Translation initiation factor eIF2B subunit delta n=1 Tax=Cyberlindnera jadinii (strain ATCC 18201 / CBS 1600 / BCRC 20928 / JCM 3617 / NBRC 0987 / NRRL Y-1542) TaxID=983966 RepID=A0A0H5C3J9_CYBJN|nr:IF-2B-domain-containing protein [Cyberlindnera jadinii NRRL Y-1542]ODV75326.1 IF-2B-domain-containing protein [Cyberlindnera jadinii NRRL Y-1542]CEP22473.1 unnamed protein product [Cyberlindnera jadinii]